MSFQAPRGTADVTPPEQAHWDLIRGKVGEMATRFGYQRIDTPAFESHDLFVRGIGEVTDIVEKETYTFEDRGGDLLTLRPEGTAPVCRAYLEHGMHTLPQPVRLYYLCPVFRYERPQSGRFRQHHQFGIEVFGDGDATIDAEVIEVGWSFLEGVGLKDLSLTVNSIGDPQCRPAFIQTLQGHYREHVGELCPDCQRRLEQNPLRLLDCKQERCQPIIEGAPHSIDYLCGPCELHWSSLLENLEGLGLPCVTENRLVRGFDYYTRTVFEITPPVEGRQNTLVGGGRYDGLIEELGGSPTPGIGFGMGIERVIASMKRIGAPLPGDRGRKVMVAHVGKAARSAGMRLASGLRKAGIPTVLGPVGRGLRSQLRYASSIDATHAVILGDNELKKGVVVLRDLGLGEQYELAHSPEALAKKIGEAP